MSVENLEDRLLLASDLRFVATQHVVVTLQLTDDTLELVDAQSEAILASEELANITGGVYIAASSANVDLTIDASVPVVPGAIYFDGGSGASTLRGPNTDAHWEITGTDEGTLQTSNFLEFTNVRNLHGADDSKDVFLMAANASIAGTLDGGLAGDDRLILEGTSHQTVTYSNTGLNSGSVERGGHRIDFTGMDIVSDLSTASEVFIKATNDADVVHLKDADVNTNGSTTVQLSALNQFTFPNPTTSLTIELFTGDDTFTLESLDPSIDATINVVSTGGEDQVFGPTLSDPAAVTEWTLRDDGTAEIDLLEDSIELSGFETFVGGQSVDRFHGPDTTTRWVLGQLGAGEVAGISFAEFDEIEAGTGSDTIVGPDLNTQWLLNGQDAGAVHGLQFTGIENLQGSAAHHNQFVLQAGAALSGQIDGGGQASFSIDESEFTDSSFDTTPNGTLQLTSDNGTNSLAYTGFVLPSLDVSTVGGTIEITGSPFPDDLILRHNGQLELHSRNRFMQGQTIQVPSDALTINLGGGFDRLEIQGQINLGGASLTVNGKGSDIAEAIDFIASDLSLGLSSLLGLRDQIIVAAGAEITATGG